MADILGSFAEGFQRGRAQFAANEAARAEAAEKQRKAALEDAKFQLQVAGESRLAQGAAETAWSEIDKAINDENWDPSKINQARSAAMRFDQTYGNIWKGGSALKYVEESLHLGPQKMSGAVEDGKQGPPAPDTETKHPLWGYVSPEQKMAAIDRQRTSTTKANMGDIRGMALDRLERTRGADGFYDPDMAYRVLSEFEAEVGAGGKYDEPTVRAMFDDIEKSIADINKMRLDTVNDGGQAKEKLGLASARLSSWIRSSMMIDKESFDFTDPASFFAAKAKMEPIALEAEGYMNTLLLNGVAEPAIKVAVGRRFADEAGQWMSNPDDLKWMRQFAGAPVGITNAANVATDTAIKSGIFADESLVDPVYDQHTGIGLLVDRTTGATVQFWPFQKDIGVLAPASGKPDGAQAEIDGRKYVKVNGAWELVDDADGN